MNVNITLETTSTWPGVGVLRFLGATVPAVGELPGVSEGDPSEAIVIVNPSERRAESRPPRTAEPHEPARFGLHCPGAGAAAVSRSWRAPWSSDLSVSQFPSTD
jgi:hypothetical protein